MMPIVMKVMTEMTNPTMTPNNLNEFVLFVRNSKFPRKLWILGGGQEVGRGGGAVDIDIEWFSTRCIIDRFVAFFILNQNLP